jgi:hypothetical protein
MTGALLIGGDMADQDCFTSIRNDQQKMHRVFVMPCWLLCKGPGTRT